MDKRKLTIGTALLLLAAATAWAFGFLGGDAAVAELQQLRNQMSDDNLTDAERQQLRTQFRQRLDGLSDAQRRAVFEAGREQWRQRAERRMDEFFALAPPEQQKRLDDLINRLAERRNERNQDAAGDRGARRGDRGRGRNMTEAQRDAWRKQRLDRSTPKERAQRDEFRRRLRERMEQRGINPGSIRGGGRGGRRMV